MPAISNDGYDSLDEARPPPDSGIEVPEDMPSQQFRYQIFLPVVQNLVNALGGFEPVKKEDGTTDVIYRPGDSVLAVLKDLKKMWRKDDTDDERTVARCMARAGLMKELVGLVKECAPRGDWGRKVSLMALDLIAGLTWPIDVASELREIEDETEAPPDYASLLRYQVEYKALLLQGQTLKPILALLIPSFANAGRDDKEDRVISLGLHIVRNLLAIKDVVAADSATGDKQALSNLQSTLITQLDELTYLELFLTLAAESHKSQFNQFNVLVLDMVQLLLRSIKVQDLAMDQKKAPSETLRRLLEAESREKGRHGKPSTRHSRFGTTIAVRAPTQNIVLHSQSAITADMGKLLDDAKKTRKPPTRTIADDSVNSNLSSDAIVVLQKFSREFLDCFNEYFRTLLKDIQYERQKVRPADTIRVLFVSRFLMEYLLELRRKANKPDNPESMAQIDRDLPLSLVAEMTEFATIRWVVARIRMSMDDTPIAFTELQSGVDCFTQVLLVLDAMMQSGEEDDKEVADVLQNQIYYNGDLLDTALQFFTILRPDNKNQPLTLQDSTVHFAYVLLRMLEKYSKSKSYMYVRKRKGARKKQGAVPVNDIDDENEEMLDTQKGEPSYSEHAFTFTTFERRFAQETVAKSLLTYLARYHALDGERLKRVVNLIHRQVVKGKAEGLFFTIPALHLFKSIMDEKDSLPPGDASKDLVKLITYILRSFFKMVEKDPWTLVEATLPKGRAGWRHLSSIDDEDDDGMGGQRSRIQEKLAQQQLEFTKKSNLSWSQQMGVVISILVKEGRQEWIKEVIGVLEIALAGRQEVVLRVDADRPAQIDEDEDDENVVRDFRGPSKEAIEQFEKFDLAPRADGLLAAVTRNPHIKLMLSLLSFERVDADATELQWFLPSSVLPSAVENSLSALNQFLTAPPEVEDPKKLLRRKRKTKVREDADGEAPVRAPRVRKAAEVQTYKSAAFIEDSDDEDPEVTAAFFAREEELRRQMSAAAEANGHTMRRTGTKKRKRGDKKGTAAVGAAEGGEVGSDGDVPMDQQSDSDGESDGYASESSDDDDQPPARRRKSVLGDPDESDVSVSGTPAASAVAPRPRTQRIIDSD